MKPAALLVLFLILPVIGLFSQSSTFDWSGTNLIPKTLLLEPSNWTPNVPYPSLGDKSQVISSGDTLILNWTFGTGNRHKWAQCYLYLQQPISLDQYDLFSFDIKGLPSKGYVGFELKFEDGSHQAVVRWDGLAGLNRWGRRITAAKKQFENAQVTDWSRIRVISFAVYAQASAQYTGTDQGAIGIHNLAGTNMAGWERATSREFIDPGNYLTIMNNALSALISRQKPTGLLTTWNEDGSSWLYGQGLALKALSLEGTWISGTPVNAAAAAAEKLARFLSSHQQPEGYWPRAWNAVTGTITVLREADGTVWMGDFPWIITGLQAYYKKSGDQAVVPAIQKGLAFLRNLIQPDGRFMTVNPATGIKSEVASCEAYAAAILSLYESGDKETAGRLLKYIEANGWDPELRCWREATISDRIVLFANTWMSHYLFEQGKTQMGLDALTLAGRVLFTHGNGETFGMDGIVPLAIWNEGTLSYINAGGPGSVMLFDELCRHLNPDGTVSHYNENLGSMGGIWAVDWHSLDGTSWLYFTASGKSPFDILEGNPVGVETIPLKETGRHFSVSSTFPGKLVIKPLILIQSDLIVRLIRIDGRVLWEYKIDMNSSDKILEFNTYTSVYGLIFMQLLGAGWVECFPVYLR